ncbi:SDR family NAD(P)-dependent oxidoreductase [Variovorax sp. PCZ-1]|uniref:SDR family NAD(P)-dependent oxidoreductase n=1 Tax=Variovorax sp. PCZ-1 TaxID=2835533 RepID=UPI001BCFA077|nr:SDR family NAD(P)-dependent oxidoreductase [Variovorax sp. PCZ-1]MBS7806776.1 SDR family NAD(P)-dependent oxidoreductase [Variovorax sp. PCZ-1]
MNLYIITGASRGMGLALAQQLILPGNALLCISRKTNDTLASLAEEQQVPLTQWAEDLNDAAPVAKQLKAWLAKQPLAYDSATLVNNAGVIPQIAPLSDVPAHEITRAMRVGIEAPMLLTSAFLLATANWRIPKKVLNISSGLGRRAIASQAGYCAAKAAMDHFTRCVALEESIKHHGAKVCSLAPGVIDTDMQVQLRSAPDTSFPDKSAFVGMKNQGSLTSPHEAAGRLIAYLSRSDFGSNPVADVRDVA